MKIFSQQDNKLIAKKFHETIQIEPWGKNSLRVRSTMSSIILDDLPGALLKPKENQNIDIKIENDVSKALIINGEIICYSNRPFFSKILGKISNIYLVSI